MLLTKSCSPLRKMASQDDDKAKEIATKLGLQKRQKENQKYGSYTEIH